MKSSAIACAIAAVLTASCAKIVVTPVKEEATVSKGMIYALPNTVIRIQIKLNLTKRTGAPFAKYAAIFAPDGDVICHAPDCTKEHKASITLDDGATFATYGEPDPQNVYLVEFTKGGATDQQMSMTWNEAGLLSTAGSSVTNRTSDIVMSGLKLVASAGTKGLFGGAGVKAAARPYKCPDQVD